VYSVLLSWCIPHLALAENGAGGRQAVELVLVGSLATDAMFRDRATSWFDAQRFLVSVQTAPTVDRARLLAPPRKRVLSVWVALHGDSARLYFVASTGGDEPRYLVRTLLLANGLDEIGAEELAEVLHLSALALLEGELSTSKRELERAIGESGATRQERAIEDELSRKRPAGSPVAAESTFDLGVGYGVSFHSDEGVWHGPRAQLGLRLGSALGLVVSSAIALPQTVELGPVDLHTQALALNLGLRFARRLTASFAVEAVAGPGVEIVRYEPRSASSSVTARAGDTEARPALVAGGAASIGPSSMRAALVAELALSLTRTRYEISGGTERRRIAEPALLIPRLGLEVRF
jgi:hypothetical protein